MSSEVCELRAVKSTPRAGRSPSAGRCAAVASRVALPAAVLADPHMLILAASFSFFRPQSLVLRHAPPRACAVDSVSVASVRRALAESEARVADAAAPLAGRQLEGGCGGRAYLLRRHT